MRRKRGGLTRLGWFWSYALKWTIGHGYRPHRAFGLALAFVIAGALFFSWGIAKGYMVEAKDQGKVPTTFNAVMYSLDTFLPIVNLRQKDYWVAKGGTGCAEWLRYYYWLHISAGWVLTTLGIAGLTGLVKKD
jgi:hypothetical protein